MKILGNLFFRFDQWIFDRTTELKEHVLYHKLQDTLANFDEEIRSKISPLIFIAIILFPLPILGIIWKLNSKYSSQVEQKKEILIKSTKYISKKLEFSKSINLLNPQGAFNQEQFQSRITSLLASQRVSPSKLTIQNISFSELSQNLSEISGQILFRELGHNQLSNLLDILTIKERLQLTEIEINTLSPQNLVSGTLLFKKLSQKDLNEEVE